MDSIDAIAWCQTGIWKPQQKLSQYLYLYVAPSAASGLGLFTSKPFHAGAIVLSVTDPDYLARAMSHADITAAGFSHADIFQVGSDLFIPPYGGPDDFTNHSCEPNCGLAVRADGFSMVALYDIRANEELTYDYSTHQEHPAEDMECACGSHMCRGLVRSFSTLPPQLRRRYLSKGIVAGFAAEEVAGFAAEEVASFAAEEVMAETDSLACRF
jgi:uncharacterized protein